MALLLPNREKCQKQILVCSIPLTSGNNPYLTSINDALEKRGIYLVKSHRVLSEIRNIMQPGLILHFHWPSRLYTANHQENQAKILKEWGEFLALARRVGCRIVWTAHNLYESPSKSVDLVARTMLVAAADHVIVHCKCAVHELEAEFGTLPSFSVISHPSYKVGLVGSGTRSRTSTITFLAFGLLRNYKNLEFLAKTFSSLCQPDFRLVIAGQPHHTFVPDQLRAICSEDPRIQFLEGEVAEHSLPGLFMATDVVVFSYRQVLTSGSITLAQSYGKPVLAPRLGCIPDVVSNDVGELFDANCAISLAAAMERIAMRDLDEMGRQALTLAQRETPESFAKKLETVYRTL
jgi:beta-1,4-mannosyltransferase